MGEALQQRMLQAETSNRGDSPPEYAQALARQCDAGHSLGHRAARYLAVRVCGRAPNTVAAKARDLATFIEWFLGERGHGDISLWVEIHTRHFLRHLEGQGRQPTTINRALCTLKHFARWVHDQPGAVRRMRRHPDDSKSESEGYARSLLML